MSVFLRVYLISAVIYCVISVISHVLHFCFFWIELLEEADEPVLLVLDARLENQRLPSKIPVGGLFLINLKPSLSYRFPDDHRLSA